MADRPGALVISLDFELHWGVRDHVTRDDAMFGRLPDARQAVRDMLDVFTARQIRATWATVGFLFASTRDELDAYLPGERPAYRRGELDPYVEAIGVDEERDPEHLAGSLVELISRGEGQEVGSHTFSHYYCLEAGQNEAAFRADLAAAQAIALRRGLELTSLVLPRNQWNPAYARSGPRPGVHGASAAPNGHGATELTGRATRAFSIAGSGWPTRTSGSRLLQRQDGTTSCSRQASATYPPAPSCARTTPPASGSSPSG